MTVVVRCASALTYRSSCDDARRRSGRLRSGGGAAYRRDHFGGIGKPPAPLFTDQLVVDPDGELARAPDEQLGFDAKILFQLGCRTDSLGPVPSTTAIADGDLHALERSTVIAIVSCMRQQEKDQKQASEPPNRVTKPRDEERQKSHVKFEADDDNPFICRGID